MLQLWCWVKSCVYSDQKELRWNWHINFHMRQSLLCVLVTQIEVLFVRWLKENPKKNVLCRFCCCLSYHVGTIYLSFLRGPYYSETVKLKVDWQHGHEVKQKSVERLRRKQALYSTCSSIRCVSYRSTLKICKAVLPPFGILSYC